MHALDLKAMLKRNRARRILFGFFGIPIVVTLGITSVLGVFRGQPFIVLVGALLIPVITCIYNALYIQSLSEDQLGSTKYYKKVVSLMVAAGIWSGAGSMWVSLNSNLLSMESAVLLVSLYAIAGGYFGLSLPLSLHRRNLEIQDAEKDYIAVMELSESLQRSMHDNIVAGHLYDFSVPPEQVNSLKDMIHNVARNEYRRSRMGSTTDLYNTLWIVNPLLGIVVLLIAYMIT